MKKTILLIALMVTSCNVQLQPSNPNPQRNEPYGVAIQFSNKEKIEKQNVLQVEPLKGDSFY